MKIDITGASEKLAKEFPKSYTTVQVEMIRYDDVDGEVKLEWDIYEKFLGWFSGKTFDECFDALKAKAKQLKTSREMIVGSFVEE